MRAALAVAWSASVGGLLGLWSAWQEIELHGYAELGFWRTASALLAERGLRASALGAAVGLGLALAWLLLLDPRRLDPSGGERSRGGLALAVRAARASFGRPGVLAAVLACMVACVGLILERGMPPELGQLAAVLLAAALVWGALALAHERGPVSRRAFVRPALIAFLAFACFLLYARLSAIFGLDGELGLHVILAACAVFAVMFACNALEDLGWLGRPRARAWALAWIGALPLLLPPLATVALPRSAVARLDRPPNVLMIGIDSLRLDHTTLGEQTAGPHVQTPNFSRLGARGTVFLRAISQAPWTLPSFASIFTGKYPNEHGAVSNKGYLREREITLSEILREAGFATASIVSHYYVNNTHGFGQGYEEFDRKSVLGEMAITSADISDRAIGYLQRRDERPFFLFLHYFDPHYEYRDQDDFRFADDYRGWLRDELQIQNVRFKRHWLGAAEKQWLLDLYDEEIAFTDREIGRLLDHLERSGLDENTLIVLVADHGEEFFEHGWIGHTITLYDEVLRVPLVIALPGESGEARKVTDVVETRALFSTVLDAVGCSWSEGQRPASLLPYVTGGSPPAIDAAEEQLAFSSVWTPDTSSEVGQQARQFSVRSARWKLIWDQARGVHSLFDLANDPGEQRDLSVEQPEELARLKAVLEPWVERMQAVLGRIPFRKLGAEDEARLRALGYL